MAYTVTIWPFARFDGTDDPNFEYVTGAKSTDGVGAAGFYPQNSSTMDMTVGVERDVGGNLVFKDSVAGSHTLTSLIGGGFDPNRLVITTDGALVYTSDGFLVTI